MGSEVAQREDGGPSGSGTDGEVSLPYLKVAGTPLRPQIEVDASLAGFKRKIEDVDGLDDTPSPSTAKRQFLGLTFFTSALLGLFPIQKMFKSLAGKTAEELQNQEPAAQAPTEEALADPITAEHVDVHTQEALMSQPEAEEDAFPSREGGLVDNQLNDDAIPDENLPENLAAEGNPVEVETIDGAPLPAAYTPAFVPVKRQHAPQYIPPVIKPLKVIKRSELRRQLQEKVRPAAVAGEQIPATPATDIGTPKTTNKAPSTAARASRGARLIGIASTCSTVPSLYKISALDYPVAADSPPPPVENKDDDEQGNEEHDGAAGTGGLLDGMDSVITPEQEQGQHQEQQLEDSTPQELKEQHEHQHQHQPEESMPQDPEEQQHNQVEEQVVEEMEIEEEDPAQAHVENQTVEAPEHVEKHVGVVAAEEMVVPAAPTVPSPEVVVAGERGQQGAHGGPSQQVRLTESPCHFTLNEGTGAGVCAAAASNKLSEVQVEASVPAEQDEELVDASAQEEVQEVEEEEPLEEAIAQLEQDEQVEVEGEEEEQVEEQGQQKMDGVTVAAVADPHRFIPLPSLLAGADSDSNDGLWALDSPVAGILSISSAANAAMRQAAELQSAEGAETGWTPEQELSNGALAGHLCSTDSCRRVRFVGVHDLSEDEEQEKEDYEVPEGEKTLPRAAAPLQNTRASQSRNRRAVQPQPRFGPGSFVRKPSSLGAKTRSQAQASGPEEEDIGFLEGSDVVSPHRMSVEQGVQGVQEAVVTGEAAAAMVIARRLQTYGGSGLRRTVLQQQQQHQTVSSKEAASHQLREAFLNARLAECWTNGEAWARLDLSGIEVDTSVDRTSALEAATAQVAKHRGQKALDASLEQLRLEWDHLKCLRQRYVGGSPALATAAPRSILKKVSAIASPPLGQEATPPALRRDINAPGFDDILAAEIILGSGGSGSPGGKRYGGGGGVGAASADLTPGLLRSRGIKMLASLQQAPNLTPMDDGDGVAAVSAAVQQGVAPEGNQQAPALGVPSRLARTEDPLVLGSQEHAQKPHRVRSRGQRLLQALQSAAAGDPPTAAAAARLIVDPSASGYVLQEEGADMISAPRTTFISA